MINKNDVFEYGGICIVVDFVEMGSVFYRKWVGDLFNGFFRLPVDIFAEQVQGVSGCEVTHGKEEIRHNATA